MPEEKLQSIIESCVCRECGGKLEIAAIDDRPQVICRPCSKVWTQTKPEIYALAKEYVQSHNWHYYRSSIINDDEWREKANIGLFCGIIEWLSPKLTQKGTDAHEQSERIKYNIEYLNLTERQCEIHDIIMQSLMNTWPPSLLCYLEERADKLGFCGEMIVSCVADWIAEREGGDE